MALQGVALGLVLDLGKDGALGLDLLAQAELLGMKPVSAIIR